MNWIFIHTLTQLYIFKIDTHIIFSCLQPPASAIAIMLEQLCFCSDEWKLNLDLNL